MGNGTTVVRSIVVDDRRVRRRKCTANWSETSAHCSIPTRVPMNPLPVWRANRSPDIGT